MGRGLSQSRRHSVLEACANVAIGYGVSLGAQLLIFPLFGILIPLSDNILIGCAFTVVSLIRSYTLRRIFNWWGRGYVRD